MSKEMQLKVSEALQEDVNKGIVKIDSSYLKEIDVRPGDVVEIEGKRKTIAIVDRAYPGDIGLNIIRMDGIIRRNAQTSISEFVKIRKAEVKEATKIVLGPTRENTLIRMSPDLFKKGLLGRVMVKGDLVTLGGARRRRNAMVNSDFFDGLFPIEDAIFPTIFGFSDLKFVVTNTKPDENIIITQNTEVIYDQNAEVKEEEKQLGVTYEDVGGLKKQIHLIREMIELPLKHPEVFERLGIEPPKGIMLYGSPGTGKTLLAKAVANEANSNFSLINGPEIMSKYYGQSEANLRKKFEDAEKNAPSIIFIDEIDAIAPKRDESKGEVERRVVAQLLSLMDGLKSRGKVIVIAATNLPNSVDEALRRPGRFDREIEIGVPDEEDRLDVLKIHTRNMPISKDVDLKALARLTHGFVGADLAALAKEAAMVRLRKVIPDIQNINEEELPAEILQKLKISKDDTFDALKFVHPSAMREFFIEIPNTTWEDVGGLNEIKTQLKESVELPLKNPELFERMGIRPPRGILLYGPPGTGKTLLAKAVSNEAESNFILVNGPELLNKWVGESEKAVRKVFEKARQASPCVVFFDEIDSLASKRGFSSDSKATERLVNQLLTEMDGLKELHNVIVIAATNRPDILDPAILRPGRFDRVLFASAPDEDSRKSIFEIHTKNMPLSKEITLKDLALKTDGYVGADIEALCREAAMIALRKDIKSKEVSLKDFEEAMDVIGPSVTKEILNAYNEFQKKFRSLKAKEVKEVPNYYG